MGGKKDYWNFISESVPKDETVKYIHSYSEVKVHDDQIVSLNLNNVIIIRFSITQSRLLLQQTLSISKF